MGRRFLLLVFCSALALALFFFTAHGRSGCKSGGLDEYCLSPDAKVSVPGVSSEYFKRLRPSGRGAGKDVYGSGLRLAPSGPDPLHHNGNPKKPQTP